MSTPQPAIFTTGTAFHWFLHYRLDQGTDPDAVRAPIGALRQQAAEVGVHCVVGFGAGLAPALLGDDAPDGLVPFETVEGEHARAIGTQEDVFYWLHSDRHDLDFEVALASRRGLDGLATLARETPSWVYRDSQDLTGFIDGTANPKGDARRAANRSLLDLAGVTLAGVKRGIERGDLKSGDLVVANITGSAKDRVEDDMRAAAECFGRSERLEKVLEAVSKD